MMDIRTVGQLQEQVVTAARQGRQRLGMAAKNLTATAQQVRPQLPTLPKPNLTDLSRQARQIRDLGPVIAARLPNGEQLRTGAQELAGTLIAAQRKLAHQALVTAAPLAKQVADTPLARQAAAIVTGSRAHRRHAGKAEHPAQHGDHAEHASHAEHKSREQAAVRGTRNVTAAKTSGAGRKPRSKPAAK